MLVGGKETIIKPNLAEHSDKISYTIANKNRPEKWKIVYVAKNCLAAGRGPLAEPEQKPLT